MAGSPLKLLLLLACLHAGSGLAAPAGGKAMEHPLVISYGEPSTEDDDDDEEPQPQAEPEEDSAGERGTDNTGE